MAIFPIWRDQVTPVSTTAPYIDYEIQLEDGTVIYSGRAFKLPGDGVIYITMNEVCAPYIAMSSAPTLSYEYSRMAKAFYIAPKGEGYARVPYGLGADYSYVGTSYVSSLAHAPIVNKVPRGGQFWGCAYNRLYSPTNKPTVTLQCTYSGPGVVDQTYTETFTAPSLEKYIELSDREWYNKLTLTCGNDTLEYEIVDTCWEYMIVYVNALGGWDTLLVEGGVKQTDEYTRTTFKQAYRTTGVTLQPRGTVAIQNDYDKKYSLVTGWLTNDQASRMHHLLGSTNVYVYERSTNRYMPVVLTNSSCEYKTYRNQGAKLVNYTIEATVAQNFTRR